MTARILADIKKSAKKILILWEIAQCCGAEEVLSRLLRAGARARISADESPR
jgi:hypothetical protein